MTLAERLRAIEETLPAGWTEARLVLTVQEEADADRAALILASLTPGRAGRGFRLSVYPSGQGGPTVDATCRILERLEAEGMDARLSLAGAASAEPAVAESPPLAPLVTSWESLVRRLPPDWSDLYAEVELASSDDVDRAALLLGPVNPFLYAGARPAFRFRVARRFGYGVAPEMARRSLERLDEEALGGSVRVLRVFSSTRPMATQGPVWRIGGRAV